MKVSLEKLQRKLIELALAEDLGQGDVTTAAVIERGVQGRAEIRAKARLIVAGLAAAQAVFKRVDRRMVFSPACADGDERLPGDLLATVTGKVVGLLQAERTALNFLQHLSGIATLTRRYVDEVAQTKTIILDTRKTIPGLRAFAKAAVRAGGGFNHRFGLYDQYLLKNNHVDAAGALSTALRRAQKANKKHLVVEVEVRNDAELEEALAVGADVIMLDNYSPAAVQAAVMKVAGRVKLEVSGNVSLDNVAAYAATGVDFISVGCLTHSAPAADIHLRISLCR